MHTISPEVLQNQNWDIRPANFFWAVAQLLSLLFATLGMVANNLLLAPPTNNEQNQTTQKQRKTGQEP